MSDFDERIKRARQLADQKQDAEENAQRILKENADNFRSAFAITAHSVIEPILQRAKEHIHPAADRSGEPDDKKINTTNNATVSWSEKKDRLEFRIKRGSLHAYLFFVAWNFRNRIGVFSSHYDTEGKADSGTLGLEIIYFLDRNKISIMELSLEEVTTSLIEDCTATFIEKVLELSPKAKAGSL